MIMELNEACIDASTLRVVRAGPTFRGKQGHLYAPALSAVSVRTKAIHMQMLTIPSGEVGRAHKHEGHETAIYILSGESGVWHGENLESHETARAGEYVYIPAGMPHMPYNLSDETDCVAIIARTDPNEQESVVLLPDLEARHAMACAKTATSFQMPLSTSAIQQFLASSRESHLDAAQSLQSSRG